MEKIYDDDLLIKKLFDKGIDESTDTETAIDLMQERYGFEITDDYRSADMYFFREQTADGYEVFVATDKERSPNIVYDVYYYESDWFEKLPEAMFDGLTINVDSYDMDENSFDDAIEEAYRHFYSDMLEEVENDLIDKGYEKA